tara:strand:+ start:789 stop:1253 length:465 start_codon:yes stop_codon:yes gene_type:complete
MNLIKNIFSNRKNNSDNENHANSLGVELAYAALLIEVVKSDYEIDERESKKVLEILNKKLNSNYDDLHQIMELAKNKSDEATSLYEFTRLINDEYVYEEKVEMIESMWNIAFSDQRLDKYEDYLIRKIAELTYVSHSDFIKSKLKVKERSKIEE